MKNTQPRRTRKDMHANARTTPRSREDIVRLVVAGTDAEGRSSGLQRLSENRAQMGRALSRRGNGGFAGPSSRPAHSRRKRRPRAGRSGRWREQGLTYAEISERTGLSEATLSRILRGHRPMPPARACAMNANIRANCCTSTPRNSAGSSNQVTASPATGATMCAAPVGNASMSASMITRALVTRPCGPTNASTPRWTSEQVVAHYRHLGLIIQRIMTDNGSCCRSAVFRKTCARLGIKHLFTKPPRPRPTAGRALHPVGPAGMGVRPHLPASTERRAALSQCGSTLQLASPSSITTTPTSHLQAQTGGQPPDDSRWRVPIAISFSAVRTNNVPSTAAGVARHSPPCGCARPRKRQVERRR